MKLLNRQAILLFAAFFCSLIFAFRKVNKKIYPVYTNVTDTELQAVVTKYNQVLLAQDSCEVSGEKITREISRLNLVKDSLTHAIAISDSSLAIIKNDTLRTIFRKSLTEHKAKKVHFKEMADSCEAVMAKIELKISKLQKESDILLKSIRVVSKRITGSGTVNFKGTEYDYFVVNLDEHEIKMHWRVSNKHNYSSIGDVINYLKPYGDNPLMVTNAGMYKMSYEPQGLFIDDCLEKFPIDLSKPNSDNFYLKPNGVFYLDSKNIPHIDSSEEFYRLYQSKQIAVAYATQSGPMLLVNGRIHRQFTRKSRNLKIRSGVGIIDTKHLVFAISNEDANFYDFAQLFQEVFNCKNALFLDGAISRMYLSDINSNETFGNFGPMISVSKKKH